MPVASAAAPPPVEPPGVRPASHGFTVRPNTGLSDCQSASTGGTFVLPKTIAPAARTRVVAGASCLETNPANSVRPTVVLSPVTLIDSFSVIGSPRSAPRFPRFRAASAARACCRARSKSRVTIAFSLPSRCSVRATWKSRSSTAETRRRERARSRSVAVANASRFIQTSWSRARARGACRASSAAVARDPTLSSPAGETPCRSRRRNSGSRPCGSPRSSRAGSGRS